MVLDFSFDLPSPVDCEESFSNIIIGSCSALNLAYFYLSFKKYLDSRGSITEDELRLLYSLECFYYACRAKGLI